MHSYLHSIFEMFTFHTKCRQRLSQLLLGFPVHVLEIVGFVPIKSKRQYISKLAKLYSFFVHFLMAGFCIHSFWINYLDGFNWIVHIYVTGRYAFVIFLQGFLLYEAYSMNSLFRGKFHRNIFKEGILKNIGLMLFTTVLSSGIILAHMYMIIFYHASNDHEQNEQYLARVKLNVFHDKFWTYFIITIRKCIFRIYIIIIKVMVYLLVVNSAVSLSSKFQSIVEKLHKIVRNNNINKFEEIPEVLEEFQNCRAMVQAIDSKLNILTAGCLIVDILNINVLYYGITVYHCADWRDDIHKISAEIFLFLIITLIPSTIHSKVSSIYT